MPARIKFVQSWQLIRSYLTISELHKRSSEIQHPAITFKYTRPAQKSKNSQIAH